jgi:hypothetical protein
MMQIDQARYVLPGILDVRAKPGDDLIPSELLDVPVVHSISDNGCNCGVKSFFA